MLLFFNLGAGEIFMVLLVVLLLFGANKIPEFAKGLGKGIRQFKDATQDIQNDIQESISETKKELDDAKKNIDTDLKSQLSVSNPQKNKGLFKKNHKKLTLTP